MKLIMENWNKFQLVTEAQVIHALYENQTITEAEFMDRIKRFAVKKGIPIAVALSLATGGMAPSAAKAADAPADNEVGFFVDQPDPTAPKHKLAVAIDSILKANQSAGEIGMVDRSDFQDKRPLIGPVRDKGVFKGATVPFKTEQDLKNWLTILNSPKTNKTGIKFIHMDPGKRANLWITVK